MPPLWCEEISTVALEELVTTQNENQMWCRELRLRINALMDSKLAKRIGSEEYATSRQLVNKEMLECQRRGRMLREEITNRSCQRKHRKS
jgi:hypothetical protein